jgi:hypothetical protein
VGAWDGSWLDRGGARVEGGSQLSRGVTRLGREHGSVAHTRRGEGARGRGWTPGLVGGWTIGSR